MNMSLNAVLGRHVRIRDRGHRLRNVTSGEWNAESTLKLKEVVVSAREQFKWQTTGADDTPKEESFEEWLEPRNLALRPLYRGKSAVMPTLASKRGMRANTARHVSECTNVNLII